MITREAVGSIITHAGPKIGVASTKAFTSQLTALLLLAMHLAKRAVLFQAIPQKCSTGIRAHPHKMETVLKPRNRFYESLARQFSLHRLSLSRPRHSLSIALEALSSSKKSLTFMPRAIPRAK